QVLLLLERVSEAQRLSTMVMKESDGENGARGGQETMPTTATARPGRTNPARA
ncbi:hypothetical protein HaLaN_32928, partial [Haematococcus lacustris]